MQEYMKFETKQAFRDYVKKARQKIDISVVSFKIINILQNQDFYKFSKNILNYYPFNNEIDLREMFNDNMKNWYLPRLLMECRSLVIHPYKYGDVLAKNKWGIYEPPENDNVIDIHKIDVAIIPAMAVDKKGNRLGYGAGFYDRFLPGLRKDCLKIVPVSEEFFFDELPSDQWDIPVDMVLTQERIVKTS